MVYTKIYKQNLIINNIKINIYLYLKEIIIIDNFKYNLPIIKIKSV